MFDYQAPQDLLKDRVILITGAGDGIGRACALSCAGPDWAYPVQTGGRL